MRIEHNQPAFSTWTSYTLNLGFLQKSMTRLSTGMILSTDDPAGIGISERLRAQAKGVAMSRANADNAISLTQTADSWLQKVSDMISRMKSLAIEAGSIVSASDLANTQTEFKAMQDEVARITSYYTAAGTFDDMYLFRGGSGVALSTGDQIQTGNITVQVGPDVDQKVSLSLSDLQITNTAIIGTMNTYTYNSSHVLTGSAHTVTHWNSIIDTNKMSVGMSSADIIGKIDLAIDHIANTRASMGSQQTRLQNTRDALLSYEDNLNAAESKIRDIDMASESSVFAKYQVLVNAGLSVLSQANSLPSAILNLLR